MLRRALPLWLLATVAAGCATRSGALREAEPIEVPPFVLAQTSSPEEWEEWPKSRALEPGRRIVERTRRALAAKRLRKLTRRYPDDCSGLVRFAYAELGVDPMAALRRGENGVSAIWRRAQEAGALFDAPVPIPGDLVFFRETYDRNRDRRRNDGLTHVGVVEEVEADGTVVFIHRGHRGVARARMNLAHPGLRASASGRILNDYVRQGRRKEPGRLAGELFAGFARFEGPWPATSRRVAMGEGP